MKKIILIASLILFASKTYSVELLMVIPADTATNVPVDIDISVTFDQEITPGELLDINISPSVKNVSSVIEGNNLIIRHDDFKPNTTYIITIPYGVINEYNYFDITWSFTTGNSSEDDYILERNE